MPLNIAPQKADIIETKRKLVLAYVLGAVGGFRGLPNPAFREHPLNFRMLLSPDASAPADVWKVAASNCWLREVEDLRTYGARMRADDLRD